MRLQMRSQASSLALAVPALVFVLAATDAATAAEAVTADPFATPGKHVPVAAHGGRGGWGGPEWYTKGWGGWGWGYGAGQGLYAGALVSGAETAPYYDFTFGYPTRRKPFGYGYTAFPHGRGYPYYNISYGYYRSPSQAPQ